MRAAVIITTLLSLAVAGPALGQCPEVGSVAVATTESGDEVRVDLKTQELLLRNRSIVAVLPELACLTDLREMDLADNPKLSELNLQHAPALYSLDISRTAIEPPSLQLEGPSLLILRMAGIGLRHLPDALPATLMELVVSHNGLVELDTSRLPYLSHLEAAGNALRSLDLSHNPALFVLDLADNLLRHLDLNNQPELDRVDLSGNPIAP